MYLYSCEDVCVLCLLYCLLVCYPLASLLSGIGLNWGTAKEPTRALERLCETPVSLVADCGIEVARVCGGRAVRQVRFGTVRRAGWGRW